MRKYRRNDMRELSEQYFEWMGFTNYSPNTIRSRRIYLGYFFDWCDERSLADVVDVSRPVVERYQKYLFHYKKKRDGKLLSVRAQHTRLVAVRAYFKWLARKNHILYNPAADIDMPKLGHPLPKAVFTISETEKILSLPNIKEAIGLRNRAILEVLYSTGIRRMELIRLGVYDIDRERGTLMIRKGKGNKDRVVPIGDRAIKWVEKYLEESRPQFAWEPDEHVLFLSESGEALTANRLTQMVRNVIDKADIGKRGSCHLFRHTMATLMLENGADIRFIQQILGHVSIETTKIYTRVSIRQVKDVHTATHPAKDQPHRAEELWKELEDELNEEQKP